MAKPRMFGSAPNLAGWSRALTLGDWLRLIINPRAVELLTWETDPAPPLVALGRPLLIGVAALSGRNGKD